jgi:hypothetical protein
MARPEKNTRELLQFLYIARGSVSELDTQLEKGISLLTSHSSRLTVREGG